MQVKKCGGGGGTVVCVVLMVVVPGCQINITWSTGNFPVTMTQSPAQCVLHPESIQPWIPTGRLE